MIGWRIVRNSSDRLAAGLGGMVLGLLLHFTQHVAYGYGPLASASHESFLQGVNASSPRRFVVLCVCGAVAGIGWWALYRFGRPLVSIRKAVEDSNSRMPFFTTIGHDLLQIVTVGRVHLWVVRLHLVRLAHCLLDGCLTGRV